MTQFRFSTESFSRRRARFGRGAAVGLLAVVASLSLEFATAQSQSARTAEQPSRAVGNVAAPDGSGTLFVPTLDLDSPSVFSSVDAARRNRPPKPAKVKEDLFYPDGFLTLSKETPEPTPPKSETAATEEKTSEPPRRLNPSAETTPISPPVDPEPAKETRGDQILFFASSVALAALGIFVYFDYRYREQLKSDLARNARLCSSGAVSADFADVLAKDETPFDASYIDPNLDAPPYLFGATPGADAGLTGFGETVSAWNGAGFGDYPEDNDANDRFFATGTGVDLKEENFDFAPASTASVPEPQEDFVVGQNRTAK